MIKFQKTSARGLNIVTSPMPHLESVSAGFFLPIGSRFEPLHLNGIAHFLEHMIFKGTDTKSALDLAIAIEGSGGTIDAFTSEDQTCLEARGPADLLPIFIETMSDMIWHSQFNPDEVDTEKEVIKEEILMYQENPADHISDLLSETLWPNHPLGCPITGNENSVDQIDNHSIRSFFEKHYYSKGITLSVAGNITHEEVMRLSAAFVPSLSALSEAPQPAVPNSTTTYKRRFNQRDIEQTQFSMGFHTAGRHSPDRYTIRLLSLLLGETMSSRLFQEIRENRGLCYSISSDYSLFADTGSFDVSAGLDSDRLFEYLSAFNQVISDVKNDGFNETEIMQAKRYADGQAKIALESPSARMHWMGDSMNAFNAILDPELSRHRLASVSQDDINHLCNSIFTIPNMAIASISSLDNAQLEKMIDATLHF